MKADITILVQDSHKVRAKQFDLENRVREIEIYLRSNPAEQPSR